jgi:hypothetical protein
MRALLAIALVCLAVLTSACDAVFGHLTIPTRPTTFNAASGDAGQGAGGQVHFLLCCTTEHDFDVTCLRVEGNRATIGTEFFPDGVTPQLTGRLWYLEDNPGKDDDRLQEEHRDSPPTECPAPPTSFPADSAYQGDVHVIDDFHPPEG